MTVYSRPGVYIKEVTLPQQINAVETSSAVGTFIGATPKGPITPTLVSSWTEFVKTFGKPNAAFRLPTAVYHFFANGGNAAYIVRGMGASGSMVKAYTILTDATTPTAVNTLGVVAINPGTWANSVISVGVTADTTNSTFVFSVYETVSGTTNLVEQFSDLSMDVNNGRYCLAVVNAYSKYVTLQRTNPADDTALTGGLPATTSANAALGSGASYVDSQVATTGSVDKVLVLGDYQAALTQLDAINSPLVINYPDVAYYYKSGGLAGDKTAMQAIYTDLGEYCETRGDCFAVIDVWGGATAAEATTHAASVKSTNSGSHEAIYFPWILVSDTLRNLPGATVSVPPGPAMVGQFLSTDTARGVFKSPAGLGNNIALAVATERKLTNAELDSLNTATVPVNAIRNVPGAGIVCMGARTLKNYPGDRYINLRRTIIYLKKALEDRTNFAVFENNDVRLWNALATAVGRFLLEFWVAGGLRGASPAEAFYVKCDKTTNTDVDIQNGVVNIEIGVALQYPAEFVVINLGQITGNATL